MNVAERNQKFLEIAQRGQEIAMSAMKNPKVCADQREMDIMEDIRVAWGELEALRLESLYRDLTPQDLLEQRRVFEGILENNTQLLCLWGRKVFKEPNP